MASRFGSADGGGCDSSSKKSSAKAGQEEELAFVPTARARLNGQTSWVSLVACFGLAFSEHALRKTAPAPSKGPSWTDIGRDEQGTRRICAGRAQMLESLFAWYLSHGSVVD